MLKMNQVIANGLADIGALYDKLGDGRKFTYWKAAKSIRSYEINSIDDLLALYADGKLHNVGDAIMSKAIDFAEGRKPKKMVELEERIKVLNAERTKTNPHKHYTPRNVAKDLVQQHICGKSAFFDMYYRLTTLCGSYRRGKDVVGDMDILVPLHSFDTTTAEEVANEVFEHNDQHIRIISKGEKKAKFAITEDGKDLLEVDLCLCPENEFASSLLYFTGSQKTNILMRAEAKKRGYSLSEHGLRKVQTNEIIRFKTEKEYFDFLELHYLEPQER